MRDNYFFQITNRKKYYYTVFANILLLICFVLYALVKYNLYKNNQCNSLWVCIILPFFILLIFLVRLFFVFTKRNLEYTNFHLALLATVCWASIGNWLPACIILAFGLFEYLVNRDAICSINKNGVQISTIPAKKYTWDTIENVLLKNGYFTLDLKNNKLFQVDISEEVIPFDEKDLEDYVERNLKK
jgi:NADH:ubiquinone oxidoreductase subunit 5 (subunit L)/multisubunit Na+/H+ antiporter MnhA subunit